jgi:hypothetical protein
MTRIIKNKDNTYSAFIDFRCVFVGTFEDCIRELMYYSLGM